MDMKKKLKGKLAGVVVVVLVVCLVIACGSKKENSSESGDVTSASADALREPDFASASIVTAPKKSEVVSASADATGKVAEVRVAATLSGYAQESGDYVADTTNLTNLKNPNGPESFYTQEGGLVYWENLGDPITYKGDSDAELPLNVTVTYYLDGEEMEPEEMLGVSGEVTIRFDYENISSQEVSVDGTTYEVPVPFLVLSAAYLPSDTFSNVEVSSGSVEIVDGDYVAVGYVLPGLSEGLSLASYDMTDDVDIKDYVEITADVTDFELEFTETIVSNGLFADISEDDLEDFEDLSESMDDLEDATEELIDGVGELLSGAETFEDSLESYVDGVGDLADGIAALDESLEDVDVSALKQSGSSELAQLAESIEALQEAIEKLDKGGAKLDAAGTKLLKGYHSLVEGIKSFRSGLKEYNSEGISELKEVLGDDLGNLLERLKAVGEADDAYTNFSGMSEGTESSVTFLIETDGITAED